MGFWNRRDRALERDLESLRARPDDDFVSRIAGRLERRRPSGRSSRVKVGVALGLTTLGLGAFAVFGGLGYASSAASSVASVVEVVSVTQSPVTVSVKPGKILICHKTSDPKRSYDQLEVNSNDLNKHYTHPDDIIPAPAGGCPTAPVASYVTLCHWNDGRKDRPAYETVQAKVDSRTNELSKHLNDANDIIPAPAGGCPTAPQQTTTTICHYTGKRNKAYDTIDVNAALLTVHLSHPSDIIPAPASGCPASDVSATVVLCHATGDPANPFLELTANAASLATHMTHADDIIPVPRNGCPGPSPAGSDDDSKGRGGSGRCSGGNGDDSSSGDSDSNATSSDGRRGRDGGGGGAGGHQYGGCTPICHYVGGRSHPYTLLLVNAADLIVHQSHSGDLIPAPAAGCPTRDGHSDDHDGGKDGKRRGD